MHNIHIAGTGIWYPDNMITNDELVHSYNSYVDQFNEKNKIEIDNGAIEPMLHSSSDFIEKASGMKSGGDKTASIEAIANLRKKSYLVWKQQTTQHSSKAT